MSNKTFIGVFIVQPCLVWVLFNQFYLSETGPFQNTVQSDGKGYYAYLPAVWIEQDLTWNFFFDEEHKQILKHFDTRFLTDIDGHKLLKTYCGESILLSPFFLAGVSISAFSEAPLTGYEPAVQIMIHLAAIFYLALGILSWMKFLHLYRLPPIAVQLSTLVILFGTNLLHYATAEVTMTHVYSFSMIACFLFSAKQALENGRWRYFIWCAVSLALIALLRPVNVLIVLIVPFLTATSDLLLLFRKHARRLLFSCVLFGAICSLQLVLNYIQCGRLFPWSYGEEGFFWLKPAISDVLFGFRKGLFVYTPVLILVIFSLVKAHAISRRLFNGVIFLWVVVVYLIAAWWNWYYGPGFGHRAFIDWYPVLFLPLPWMAAYLRSSRKWLFLFIGVCCMVLNLFQTFQYESGIWEKEDMSFGGYKCIFMQSGPEFKDILAGEHELHYLPIDDTIADTLMDFTGQNAICQNDFCEWPDVFVMDHNHLFSPVFSFTDKKHALKMSHWFNAKIRIFTRGGDPCRNAALVLNIADSLGNRLVYKAMRFRDFPAPNQNSFEFSVEQHIEPIDRAGCKVDIYVYNPDGTTFALDEFSLSIQSFRREFH